MSVINFSFAFFGRYEASSKSKFQFIVEGWFKNYLMKNFRINFKFDGFSKLFRLKNRPFRTIKLKKIEKALPRVGKVQNQFSSFSK